MTLFRNVAYAFALVVFALWHAAEPVAAQSNVQDPPDVFITGDVTNLVVSEALWRANDPTGNFFGTRQRARLQFRTRNTAETDTWNAWAQVNARDFVGDIEGNGRDVSLGIDRAFGPARVGLLLTDSSYELTDAASQTADSDALSYGLYALAEFGGNWFLQAFALYSEPDYVVGTDSFEVDRTAGGLTVGTGREVGAIYLTGFASVSGYTEDHPAVGLTPARDITSTTVSLGSRAYFQPSETGIGYFGLSMQYNDFDDGLGNEDDGFAPRFYGGYETQAGSGTLAFDADVGEIVDGTTSYGLSVAYYLSF
ncbi:MAG: hypothetical protein AAF601_15850 [Pseudomonadota bacterium]